MRKKIRGLIVMAVLLICFSVPAAAATESFRFEQKTDSVQVGKTKELKSRSKEGSVEKQQSKAGSYIQWKSYRKKLGKCSDFCGLWRKKKFPVKCIHIIRSYTQILPDIKQPR